MYKRQLYIWPLLALAALLLRKKERPASVWAALAGAFGLSFGFLCAIPYFFKMCIRDRLTTTMCEMENVVKKANEAGIHDKVKIMIGGAPVTQSFCDQIGADCYTPDAASAADAAVAFCKASA